MDGRDKSKRKASSENPVAGEDPPERRSFEHSRVVRTSKESQQKLFSARRRQVRDERKRERRTRLVRGFVFPVVFLVIFLAVISWSMLKMQRAQRAAEEKLKPQIGEFHAGNGGSFSPDSAELDLEKERERLLNRPVVPTSQQQ